MKSKVFGCLAFCMFILTNANAQTKEIKSATVTSFDDPYDLLAISKEDIGEMSLVVDSLVVVKNQKGKSISLSELQEGQEVNLIYEIRDRKRVVTGIELAGDVDDGKKKFTGLFEGYEGEIAFIDGRKVRLAKNATFRGVRKGDGKINIDFIGFDDDLLKRGYYMNVKGMMQPDGTIAADEVLVRKNVATKEDAELIGLVNQGFKADGLHQLQIPGGIFNASNGLYNGNISVGGVNYKLSDDIKLQGHINEVGYKLIPEYTNDPAWQKENQKIDFRFYVIDDQVPNAFAWPNGMVFIHTGLLKIIENDAQLAFVLAHEITHVLYEHGSARFKKSEQIKDAVGFGKGLLKVGTAVTDKLGGLFGKKKEVSPTQNGTNGNEYEYYTMMQKLYGLGGSATTSTKNGGSNQMLDMALNSIGSKITPDALSGLFGKDQENQADRVGLYYAQLAGYDIREVPKFWDKMMDKNDDPTFLGNIASGFKSLVQNSGSISVNLTGDIKNQLLNSSTDMIINNVFKSVYSSHPLSQNRLKSANLLLSGTYKNKDYSAAVIGGDEYKSFVAGLK